MLQAQLHGKLRRAQENLEDLLTSNVFGTFRYVPPSEGLVPFLACAEGEAAGALRQALRTCAIIDATYTFWPRLAACEPDVLIRIWFADGTRLVILVESKYRSGKSSEAMDPEVETTRPEDQLALEWDTLSQIAIAEDARPFLLYVTADYCRPDDDIAASQAELQLRRGVRGAILWLPWRALGLAIPHATSPLLADLLLLMRERYELSFYSGLSRPSRRSSWSFRGARVAVVDAKSMSWTRRATLRWSFGAPGSLSWMFHGHNRWRWIR